MKNFMNEMEVIQQLKKHNEQALMKLEEYNILIDEKNRIINKSPNIRKFLEDGEIVNLSEDEQDSILKILDVEDSIKEIEYLESYKLGAQKTYSFFKEMGFINV